jgi:hypothetical protein
MSETIMNNGIKVLKGWKKNIILNSMIVCIGLLLCSYGMFIAINMVNVKKGSVSTTGEVVSVISDHDSGKEYFYPVIEFSDKNGMSITFRDLKGAKQPKYDKGEYVQVLYYPLSPGKALVNKSQFTHPYAILLVLLGIGFLWNGVHNILGIKSRVIAKANC